MMRNLKDIFLWDETEALNGELEIALESVMDGDDIKKIKARKNRCIIICNKEPNER